MRSSSLGAVLALSLLLASLWPVPARAQQRARKPAPAATPEPGSAPPPRRNPAPESEAADDDSGSDAAGEEAKAARGPLVPQHFDPEDPRAHARERLTEPVAPPAGDGASDRPAPKPAAAKPPRSHVTAASQSSRSLLPDSPASRPRPAPANTSAAEELIRRSSDGIDFYELVDEMLDEVAHQLGREDPQLLSPLAVRLVRLSANLRPEFARTLEARLVARIVNATGVKVTVCSECTAVHSRVEEGNWILTLGAAKQEDLHRLGDKMGVKTFMDIGFTLSPDTNVIWMEASVFRASDGGVVWSDAYRSDGTTAALLRTGRRIPSRAERTSELERKIAMRPNYGYAIALGVLQMGYTGPTGNVTGGQVMLRFHERFGEDQSNLFGMQAGVFTTGPPSNNRQPQALNSILLAGYYSHNLSEPNLNKPELWAYGEAGGIFSGNEGNTFYAEGGADLHLKWRMSLSAGLMYVFLTRYANYDLGGMGFQARIAMNW